MAERTAELVASEARYQDLYHNAPDMFASVGAVTGCIVQCNRTLADVTGYAMGELVGRPILDLYHLDSRDEAKSMWAAFLATGAVRGRELVLCCEDGRKIDVSVNMSAIRDAEGRILRSRSTFRDITDFKRAAQQAERHRNELAHVGRLATTGEMAAGLAHELNQPLYALSNFARGAIRRLEAGSLDRESLLGVMQDITHQAQRAADIIRSLRRYVGQRERQHASVDLNESVRRVVGLLAGEARRRSTVMEVDLADQLPLVPCDAIQIEQVLLNLILNAMEVMTDTPQPERKVGVSTVLVDAQTVLLSVSDSGPGIDPAHADRVFDAFFTTKPDGLGLGLAISRTIVKAHGGQFEVAAQRRPWRYVPFHSAGSDAPTHMNESPIPDNRPTVFLVDDDAAVLKSVRWLLESVHLRVETFRSAHELLEAYDPEVPGCLVLDMRMPGMSGLELQEELLRRGCRHPMIFVTAHGDVPTCSRAYQSGAYDFLEKPVNDQALVDLVNRAVAEDARRRAQQANRFNVSIQRAHLTPREQEVMDLIVAGRSVKQIAAELGVGFPTAARHRSHVLEKMQVTNDVELVRLVLAATS